MTVASFGPAENLEGDAKERRSGSKSSAGDEKDPLVAKRRREPDTLADWLQDLSDHFGFKLLVTLVFVQHLQKGFANTLRTKAEPYIYKSYHVSAPQTQVYTGIASVPWSMKPFIGLLSDACPIYGYSKGPYMLLVTILGVAGAITIGLAPEEILGIGGVVLSTFMIELQCSTTDLLSEAMYSSRIRALPEKGPDLLTFVWCGIQIGSLMAILLSGPLISAFGPKVPYLIIAVPSLAVVIPVLLGYLEEKQQTSEEVTATRRRLREHPELCGLCVLTFTCSVVLLVVGMVYKNPLLNSIVGVMVVLTILGSYWLFLSPIIAAVASFSILQASLDVNVSGAAFYFFTDDAAQYPEGPHFSEMFYNTVQGSVGAMCSLLGIWTYQRYMKTWRYRNMLLATNLFFSLLSLLDVVLFARINLRMGIPDHVFLLGSSVFSTVVSQWKIMPTVVIISYLCPKGMEATMYGLLASAHNVGIPISASSGALMLELLGCQPSGAAGESAEFENLWIASAVAAVLPSITIVALFYLIPDARQDQRLIEDPDFDGTEGSLWRRWTARRAAEHVL